MGKTQIADTRLFNDTEKIALLAHYDELSEADQKELHAVIEEFDRAYNASRAKLKERLEEAVGELLADVPADNADVFLAAAERIRKGIKVLEHN